MASLAQKIQCETHIRQLLEKEGMPFPDEVEYGHGCIRLLFNEPRVVLVIDIDDYSEVDEALANRAEEVAEEERGDQGRGPPFGTFPYPGPTQRN